jgi:hypothetical protein
MADVWITQADTNAARERVRRSLTVLQGMLAVQFVLSLACLLAVWCL